MIIDFISIKEKLNRVINIILRDEINKKTPFLGTIGKHYLREGNQHSYETVDHEKCDLKMQEAESGFSLSREEMSKITIKEIIQKVQATAEDMARQMEGGALQRLSEEMDQRGRSIHANPSFSREAYLQGLEMIEIDFDDDARDKPNLPSLVMHPNLAAKVKEQEAKMTEEENREFAKKREQILDKKYQDYMERESKRRIVN